MELYAIKYGENYMYGTKGLIFRGAENPQEPYDGFCFMYYLAIYKGKRMLFDTGFRNESQARSSGITLFDIEDEIKMTVGDIYDVDMIFITHSHFDHIDNIDLFKNPKIIISEPEYDIAMEKSPEAVKLKLKNSDVIKVKDEYLYDDMFRFKVIGGHSTGSSVIYFNRGDKDYVLTGDECYSPDNILNNIPGGYANDCDRNEAFINDTYMKKIIPLTFHDSKVLLSYKLISEHIARII